MIGGILIGLVIGFAAGISFMVVMSLATTPDRVRR